MMLTRAGRAASILAVFMALGARSAVAADKAPSAKPVDATKPEQVLGPTDQLKLFTDGKGHYLAVVPDVGATFAGEMKPGNAFWASGDTKVWWQQRVGSSGHEDTLKSGRFLMLWDPRATGTDGAVSFAYAPGEGFLQCSDKRKIKLTEVPATERAAIFQDATFYKPRWRYAAYALARDDEGTYFYVDHEIASPGSYRFWRGKRGAIKPMQMVNVVSDSRGDIFTTKTGQFRVILEKDKGEPAPQWIEGKKRSTLTWVPVEQNQGLIYVELGVYEGQLLGTPCDDL